MIELTPLERFRFKCAARRERLLRKIRWSRKLAGSSHRALTRRYLEGELGAADYSALREIQRLTPSNEQLKRMLERNTLASSAYSGDDSWD